MIDPTVNSERFLRGAMDQQLLHAMTALQTTPPQEFCYLL